MPESEKESLPPYNSPIKWEIRNGERLWEQVKNGLPRPPGAIFVGPDLGDLGSQPILDFSKEGELELRLYCWRSKWEYLRTYTPPNLEETLRRHVNPNLRVIRTGVYRVRTSEEDIEYLCNLGGDIVYRPRDTRITTQEQFLEELTLALKIYQVVATEAYKNEGLEPPPIKVIIQPTETPISQAGEKSLFDIFKGDELERVRKAVVIEKLPLVSFEDIGGQEEAVNLAKRLALQIKNPEAFKKWGVTPPRAILF